MNKIGCAARRWFDIVCSLTVLVFLGPFFVLLAVCIRLESPGRAIFRQRRVGLAGRTFVMFKFRTMRSDVDPYGVSPHGRDDPRLTPLGKRLRETSLDELPQLWNVLNGTMSLIGPRPLYERQAAKWTPRQRRRLDVKPGITGYAQVFGRAALGHEEKIELDVYYVEHQSLGLDMKIIAKTFSSILAGNANVYEQRYSWDKIYETIDQNGKSASRKT